MAREGSPDGRGDRRVWATPVAQPPRPLSGAVASRDNASEPCGLPSPRGATAESSRPSKGVGSEPSPRTLKCRPETRPGNRRHSLAQADLPESGKRRSELPRCHGVEAGAWAQEYGPRRADGVCLGETAGGRVPPAAVWISARLGTLEITVSPMGKHRRAPPAACRFCGC